MWEKQASCHINDQEDRASTQIECRAWVHDTHLYLLFIGLPLYYIYLPCLLFYFTNDYIIFNLASFSLGNVFDGNI